MKVPPPPPPPNSKLRVPVRCVANLRRSVKICSALVAQNALNTCIVAAERWCNMEIKDLPFDIDVHRAFACGLGLLVSLNTFTGDPIF